jgi:hypothetical protein
MSPDPTDSSPVATAAAAAAIPRMAVPTNSPLFSQLFFLLFGAFLGNLPKGSSKTTPKIN